MTLATGSTIGIVGGGQLGRMLAVAAAQLGYKCHIYAPDKAPPAAEVAAYFSRSAFDDEAALARFGGEVDVATYEFENIAAGPLSALADRSEEHTSELQSLMRISYAVFCLKKKNHYTHSTHVSIRTNN